MALELTSRGLVVERLEGLKKLQFLDNRLHELEKKKETLLNDLERKVAQVQQKKELLAQKHTESKNFQREIDRKDLDLKCLEEEIKKLRLKLFQIKNNKEYTALLSAIGGREADKSILEDEILAMMSRLEVMQGEEKEMARHLQEEERRLEETRAFVEAQVKAIEEQSEGLRRQWQETSSLINKEAIAQYIRLIEKDNLAVVEVTAEACGGCHMALTPQTLNLLLRAQELICCQNCGRILYLTG